MIDTKLILFTLIYSSYIDKDRMCFNKYQTSSVSKFYAEWLSKNGHLIGYEVVEESIIKFISTKCFL